VRNLQHTTFHATACDTRWMASAFRTGTLMVAVVRTIKINPGKLSGGPAEGGNP
jgi:hypothetical protein